MSRKRKSLAQRISKRHPIRTYALIVGIGSYLSYRYEWFPTDLFVIIVLAELGISNSVQKFERKRSNFATGEIEE